MRQIDIESLGSKVCALARRAGESVMAIYESPDGASRELPNKADNSPLTLADLASHRCIVEGLAHLTPKVAVVSEEDVASLSARLPTGSFWLVDPLDGTKEFLARNGEFTINIAWIEDGLPLWGVVHAPALDQTYWGGMGLGAWKAQAGHVEPIHVSGPVASGARWRVVASKSHLNAETAEFIRRLGDVDLMQAGSSLKFCRVAEGSADVYPRLAPTCEWDTAAAQAVLEGAGGHVEDLQGKRLRYGKADVLNPHFIASGKANTPAIASGKADNPVIASGEADNPVIASGEAARRSPPNPYLATTLPASP